MTQVRLQFEWVLYQKAELDLWWWARVLALYSSPPGLLMGRPVTMLEIDCYPHGRGLHCTVPEIQKSTLPGSHRGVVLATVRHL